MGNLNLYYWQNNQGLWVHAFDQPQKLKGLQNLLTPVEGLESVDNYVLHTEPLTSGWRLQRWAPRYYYVLKDVPAIKALGWPERFEDHASLVAHYGAHNILCDEDGRWYPIDAYDEHYEIVYSDPVPLESVFDLTIREHPPVSALINGLLPFQRWYAPAKPGESYIIRLIEGAFSPDEPGAGKWRKYYDDFISSGGGTVYEAFLFVLSQSLANKPSVYTMRTLLQSFIGNGSTSIELLTTLLEALIKPTIK